MCCQFFLATLIQPYAYCARCNTHLLRPKVGRASAALAAAATIFSAYDILITRKKKKEIYYSARGHYYKYKMVAPTCNPYFINFTLKPNCL